MHWIPVDALLVFLIGLALVLWEIASHKRSCETDLISGAESLHKLDDFLADLLLGPGHETAPVVFGVLPNHLDQVQLRTIRRQGHQDQPVIDQPSRPLLRVDRMVHGGVVQHHQGQGFRPVPAGDPVDQVDDVLPPDRLVVHGMPQLARGIVPSPHDIGPLAAHPGLGFVGLAFGRPGPLHVRDVGEAAFIQVEQPDPPLARRRPAAPQGVLGGGKPLRAALFLSDRRVRFHDNPRAFRPAANRSRLKPGAAGCASLTRRAISCREHGSARAIASAVSSIATVSLGGRPPLWPFSSPINPTSRPPLFQLYPVCSLTPRISATTFAPWPLLKASSPSARGRKSRNGGLRESSSKVRGSASFNSIRKGMLRSQGREQTHKLTSIRSNRLYEHTYSYLPFSARTTLPFRIIIEPRVLMVAGMVRCGCA